MSTSASAEQPVFAPGSTPTLEPVVAKLEKFILYETTSFLYVVGCDKRQCEYRVLKLDRRVSLHVQGIHANHGLGTERTPSCVRCVVIARSPVLVSFVHACNVLPLGYKAVHPSRLSEILLEDDCVYSREELKDMLEMIHEGNKAQGGLVRLQTGFGILGFVRFLDCYYLLLVRLFHRRMYAYATRFVRVLVLLYISLFPSLPLPSP